ncbi:MAG: ornithine--oxo-acid transaminase [Planctomycetes bacterium]|nr:ornithine--oxo-acid transaminase [Planctomycetota bacterium]
MTDTSTDARHWIDLEDRFAAHNYHPLDVVLTRGEGIWVWDVEGKKYLDFLSAYSAVNQGHNHPKIIKAVIDQLQTLSLTSRAFRNDRFGPFCEKLSKLSGYDSVLMMNTGAEAVETAIKAARKWGYRVKGVPDGKAKIITFTENFHGRTTTIVGFSCDPVARDQYGPFTPGFVTAEYNNLESTAAAFDENVVAVLIEPIQGEAGVIVPSAEFMQGVRKLCDEHNALLICDEIQSGLGRAGHFFAHTMFGICADAVTIGKALSGGVYPVSAFLAKKEIMDVFTPGSHGSTYGGNPVACAAAEAALDVLVDQNLCERSKELGEWLANEMRAIDSPHVKEIRAAGLWIGVELHESAGGARKFCEALERAGMLCKETHTHTIRFAPPLVIEKADLEWALGHIRKVLTTG